MDIKDRNKFITRLIELRNLLKAKRIDFNQKLDSSNDKSKLSGLVKALRDSNMIDSEKSAEVINKLNDSSKDALDVIDAITKELESRLHELGYSDKENNNTKTDSLKNEDEKDIDIVKKYEKIIESVEKMINELDKTMKEVEQWMDEVSDLIKYNFIENKQEQATSNIVSETNDKEVNLLNLN